MARVQRPPRDSNGANPFAHLMNLPPVDATRNKLRDVVRGSDDVVMQRARKYLTLSAEYAARETFRKAWFSPIPKGVHYPRSLTTPVAKPKPFETRGALPGIVEWFEARGMMADLREMGYRT